MPTIEQIRAARALLDWSQSDLADHAGLSQTGIARIENGTNKPNSQTLEKIKTAFDDADIEFIDDNGVKKRTGDIKIHKGANGFINFMNDVTEVAESHGGQFCVSNVDETLFEKWLSEEFVKNYLKRMKEIAANGNLKFKILVKEGDGHTPASGHAEYRWMRGENFGSAPFYVYGEKMAIIIFTDTEVDIYVIENREIANAQRKQFDIAWGSAEKF